MITNGKLIGLFFAKLRDVLTLTLYIWAYMYTCDHVWIV